MSNSIFNLLLPTDNPTGTPVATTSQTPDPIIRHHLNGLISANIILDALHRPIKGSAASGMLLSPADRPPVNALMQGSSTYESREHDKPCREAWERLDRLRTKTIHYYGELRDHHLCCRASNNCHFLSQWFRQNSDDAEMRINGLRALQAIWTGQGLRSFDVFSAMVVQFCIFETDKYHQPGPSHSAIHHVDWRNVLSAKDQDHLNYICSQVFLTSNDLAQPQNNASIPPMSAVSNQVVQGSGDQFTNIPMLPHESSPVVDQEDFALLSFDTQPSFQSSPNFHSAGNFSPRQHFPSLAAQSMGGLDIYNPDLSFSSQPDTTSITNLQQLMFPSGSFDLAMANDSSYAYPHSQATIASYSPQLQQPRSLDLRKSEPFRAVVQALGSFGNGQTDSILPTLSVSRVVETAPQRVANNNQDRMTSYRKTRYNKSVQEHLLNPLRECGPLFECIAEATEFALHEGLVSLRLVESYLLILGKNLLSPDEFQTLRRVAIQGCQVISAQAFSEWFLYSGPTPAGERYSHRYFQALLTQPVDPSNGRWSPRELLAKLMGSASFPLQLQSQTPGYLATPSFTTKSDITDQTSEAFSQVYDDTKSSPDTSIPSQQRTCDICGRTYQGRSCATSLSRHKRKHRQKSYECPYCPEKASRSDNLKTHIKNNHPGYDVPTGKTGWSQNYPRGSSSQSSRHPS